MTTGKPGDAIQIEALELSVRIGVSDEERATPQRLTISITIWPETDFRNLDDQLARTVNYAAVCQAVKDYAADRSDKLIETLANEVASHLLARFPLQRVRIELRKFILRDVQYVAVLLTRDAGALET